MKIVSTIIASMALAVLVGCATTTRDNQVREPTWRQSDSPSALMPPLGENIPLHVVSFGLASSVTKRYPELAEAKLGWGISNRIVDALYASQRFTFVEEKAEMARRISEQFQPGDEATDTQTGIPRIRWLLYGEIAGLELEKRESVIGIRARATLETRIVVQLRLVDRDTGRIFPTSATGAFESTSSRNHNQLDDYAVAEATDKAVRTATADLLSVLDKQ